MYKQVICSRQIGSCLFKKYKKFSVFLSSYRNTIINQSARVFSLSYFLNNNKSSRYITLVRGSSNQSLKSKFEMLLSTRHYFASST